MNHALTRCDTCGALDDHPKWHYGLETFHHDCVPFKVLRDVTTTGYWQAKFGTNDAGERIVVGHDWIDGDPVAAEDMHPLIAHALAVREAALSGTRGDALREHIATTHPDKES